MLFAGSTGKNTEGKKPLKKTNADTTSNDYQAEILHLHFWVWIQFNAIGTTGNIKVHIHHTLCRQSF